MFSKIKKKSVLGLAMVCFMPAVGLAQSSQVIVSGDAPAKTEKDAAKKEVEDAAGSAAAVNAWRIFRSRIADQTRGLSEDQNTQMAGWIVRNCGKSKQEFGYDKTNKQATYRFRFDCVQNELVDAVQQVKGAAVAGSAVDPSSAGGQKAKMFGLYFLVRQTSLKEFDADRVETAARADSLSKSGNAQGQQSSQASASVEGRVKTSEKKKETFGYSEGAGGGGESASQKSDVKVKGKIEESQSSSGSSSYAAADTANRSSEVRSGGSTTQRAAQVDREISDASDLGQAIETALGRSSVEFVKYIDIEGSCGAPKKDQILKELRSLGPSDEVEISAATRTAVIKVARAESCDSQQYYLQGYAEVGVPTLDPITGGKKVTAKARVVVMDIRGNLPKNLLTSEPVAKTMTGSDEPSAIRNALVAAGQEVAQQIINKLAAQGR